MSIAELLKNQKTTMRRLPNYLALAYLALADLYLALAELRSTGKLKLTAPSVTHLVFHEDYKWSYNSNYIYV